jgi:hypothetical protein
MTSYHGHASERHTSSRLPRDIIDDTALLSARDAVTTAPAGAQMPQRCRDPNVCFLAHCSLSGYSDSFTTLLMTEVCLRFTGRAEEGGLGRAVMGSSVISLHPAYRR